MSGRSRQAVCLLSPLMPIGPWSVMHWGLLVQAARVRRTPPPAPALACPSTPGSPSSSAMPGL
eukprot:8305266-Alexandrium_andersonii.AAC.1